MVAGLQLLEGGIMLKRIFISAVLLIAVLSFVVSLLGGRNNSKTKESLPAVKGDRVAVIDIEGSIDSGSEDSNIFSEAKGTVSGRVMEQLRKAAKDNKVKAVLLRINSPGGSVTAAEEITREVIRFKESKKPIVAAMGDMGASAAYYIAAPCDKIYANSSTLTGSIGVYMGSANFEELMKKLGVYNVMIKSGKHKDILSSSRPMTAEERVILQNMVNEMFAQFVDTVSKGRNMSEEKVRALADGRVYTGKQAKELGLVDELGNYYDALDAVGAMIGVKGTPEVIEYGDVTNWKSWFGAQLSNQVAKQLVESFELKGMERPLTPRAEG